MEFFGIPIVFTARDIIGFGLGIFILLLWVCLGIILLVLKLAEIYIKWRNKTD